MVDGAVGGRVLHHGAAHLLAKHECVLRAHLHAEAQASCASAAHSNGLWVALVLYATKNVASETCGLQ